VIAIVNNNSSTNQGISFEIAARGGKLEGRHGDVWQFTPSDFAAIARSMGAEGLRVESPNELRDALDVALNMGKPVVIDVVTDQMAEAPKTWLG
jgi:thiamine pyrophosphate-dependent acetolactate synthase large subunit-like protein